MAARLANNPGVNTGRSKGLGILDVKGCVKARSKSAGKKMNLVLLKPWNVASAKVRASAVALFKFVDSFTSGVFQAAY